MDGIITPLGDTETKRCARCKEIKGVEQFHKNKTSRDGLNAYCKQCACAAAKRYAKEHKDKRAEYRQKTRDHRHEYDRLWRRNNPEKAKAKKERWLRSHPNRSREYLRARRKNHTAKYDPTKNRIKKSRRAERLKQGKYTQQEWDELKDWFRGVCLCCGTNENITRDHVIPVAIGGPDHLTNLQPLCFSCNSAKGDRSIKDYRSPHALESFLRRKKTSTIE